METQQLWPEIPVISTNKTPFIECVIRYHPTEITWHVTRETTHPCPKVFRHRTLAALLKRMSQILRLHLKIRTSFAVQAREETCPR